MAKYILKYSDLQRGDIIIDREDSDESRKIRKFTHSDYSHARLYVNASVMEANGLGVQSVNPRGSGDRYLNHLYTIEKWHVQQESIQIAESITLY